MKLKKIIPYFIAHQFCQYESQYINLIIKGYSEEIKKNLLSNNYYFGELDILYYMAINYQRTDIINFFKESHIKINRIKKVFVYESAKMNYPEIIEEYLKNKKPNKKSKFLFLLLKIATLHSSYNAVTLLLKYGVDYTQDSYYCVRTILNASNFDLFKLFHEYGLDINKKEYLFTAILKDNKEWFNYLIQNGFIIDEINKDIIYNFLGFNGSINIIEMEKSNFINEKELMIKSSEYNPLAKKWFLLFYKKVDFYKKVENKLISKNLIESKKIIKI